jgi:8-oxo-dGTP pyrophosphatase MutT (NUDIX family)
VVYLERADGRVLALTRGGDFSDWHMPGGKWEQQDGEVDGGALGYAPNLRRTAWREICEETGVRLDAGGLRPLISYTTRSGRLVVAFWGTPPAWCPDRFPSYPAGQPAWVPPGMLTLPWSSFGPEAARLLAAVEQAKRGGP